MGGGVGGDVGFLTFTVVRVSTTPTPATRAEQAPLLVTVPDAARILAISRSALYDLIWNGELAPVHIGRSVRFALTELERFVAERSTRHSPRSRPT